MFSNKDTADYYNTTQVHYKQWWKLEQNLSLHYGIWEKETKTFDEALKNTNRILASLANISEKDKMLDAGCGVGGAAFFVHESTGASVIGLSLSERQLELASTKAIEKGVTENVNFQIMDFTQTTFPAASFDVIWACESVCHVEDKRDFIREAYRLLKKGGRLVMADFFSTHPNQVDKNEWMKKWGETWSVSNFAAIDTFKKQLTEHSFELTECMDYTSKIEKSAKRMYYAGLLATIPSEIYNFFNPDVSHFAKKHYKCAYYQYKALKEDLWRYIILSAVKS